MARPIHKFKVRHGQTIAMKQGRVKHGPTDEAQDSFSASTHIEICHTQDLFTPARKRIAHWKGKTSIDGYKNKRTQFSAALCLSVACMNDDLVIYIKKNICWINRPIHREHTQSMPVSVCSSIEGRVAQPNLGYYNR